MLKLYFVHTICHKSDMLIIFRELLNINKQGGQKVSVHLTITVQSSGAQRLFDHPVHTKKHT